MASQHAGSSVQDPSVGEKRSEICRHCNVEVPVDPDYVMLWLKHAEVDAKEANRSKSKTHALYWVQQSVEKLVKARLLAFGRCYCDIVDIGHGSLKGFLRVIHDLLQDRPLRDLIDGLTESNSQQKLGRVQRLLGDEEIRSGMAIWPPETLRMLLDVVSGLERERENLLSKAFKSGVVEYQSRSQVYDRFHRAIPARFKRRGTDVEEMMAGIYSTLGVCDHQLKGHEFLVDAKGIESRLRWAEADLRLYVLASATFPHATSSRYPAHPNAPDDFQEAAMFRAGDSGKAKRMGGLGIQHYSNRIGVIYYVRRLAGEAETTAIAMQDWWRSAASAGLEPLPPCAECEKTAQG